MENMKALLDEQKTAFAALNEALKVQSDEIKQYGAAFGDTSAKVDALANRIADIETKLNRPQTIVKVEGKAGDRLSPAMSAFEKHLRFGRKAGARMSDEEKQAWNEIETKTLTSGTDSSLGVTVPEDFRQEIIRRIPNFSNVGALVTRQPTSRDVLRFPQLAGGDDIVSSAVSVTWEDENDATTETSFSMGSVAVPVKKARALIRVSNELLEDSAVDVIGLMSGLLAEAFAHEEDSVFTNGSGGKKPEGFMTNADISAVNSGAAADFTYSGLVDLVYSLPEQYATNATFMCKRTSIANFLKLKGTQNDHPIWQPAIALGQPATLLGYPLRVNEYMPAVAGSAKPLIFGDFKKLYLVADRVGMSIKRLDEKYADTDETGFIARRRVGGRVLQPWAAKKQNIST